MLLKVPDVVWRTQSGLNNSRVRIQHRKTSNMRIDLASEFIVTARAISAEFHSIVRPANRDKVSDRKLGWASLYNVPPDEGSLWNSHDVKLPLAKYWVIIDFRTCFLGLFDNGCKHGSDGTVANFDALGVTVGTFIYVLDVFNELIFCATLFKTMEYHCGHRLIDIGTHSLLGFKLWHYDYLLSYDFLLSVLDIFHILLIGTFFAVEFHGGAAHLKLLIALIFIGGDFCSFYIPIQYFSGWKGKEKRKASTESISNIYKTSNDLVSKGYQHTELVKPKQYAYGMFDHYALGDHSIDHFVSKEMFDSVYKRRNSKEGEIWPFDPFLTPFPLSPKNIIFSSFCEAEAWLSSDSFFLFS